MTDKILYYQDNSIQNLGIVKSLKSLHDCNLYCLLDVSEKQFDFYKNQNIVKFEKIWYLYDFIQFTNEKPDLLYLSNFEKKTRIELWKLAQNDRYFNNFNPFYKFSSCQILVILEKLIKLFETILDEVKPDFVIVNTNNLKNQLFYEICKFRGIHIMMLVSGRISNRLMISENFDSIDYLDSFSKKSFPIKSFDEIKNIIHKKRLYNFTLNLTHNFLKSKSSAVKAGIKFIVSPNNSLKTQYTYFGRKKFKVLIYTFKMSLLKRFRFKFINHFSINHIEDQKFIIFPLIVEPERTLLIDSPFNTNVLETIENLSKSIPVGFWLYVKEHPGMDTRDWRSVSFYKKILSLPNVKLVNPYTDPLSLIEKCSLVITYGSTFGLESILHGKNVITINKTVYSSLKSVYLLENFSQLPQLIQKLIELPVDLTDLSKFINILEQNSFEILEELGSFTNAYQNELFYNGFLSNNEIDNQKVIDLFKRYQTMFDSLANEYVKKIHQHKQFSQY